MFFKNSFNKLVLAAEKKNIFVWGIFGDINKVDTSVNWKGQLKILDRSEKQLKKLPVQR